MKLVVIAMLVLAACGGRTSTELDASSDAAIDATSACQETLGEYCPGEWCPGINEALGACEGKSRTVDVGCGFTEVGLFGVDTGTEYFFDADGTLIAVYGYFNGTTTCLAGEIVALPACDSGTLSKSSCFDFDASSD